MGLIGSQGLRPPFSSPVGSALSLQNTLAAMMALGALSLGSLGAHSPIPRAQGNRELSRSGAEGTLSCVAQGSFWDSGWQPQS